MSTRLPAFDVLLDMARTDPDGLEALRVSMTNAVIADCQNEVNKRRLQGLQFQVDMERAKAKTPLAATIRISELMCQSLAELHRSMVESTEIAGRPSIRPAPISASNAESSNLPNHDDANQSGMKETGAKQTKKGARILPFRPL